MTSAKDLKALTQTLNILYAEDEEMLRSNMQKTLMRLFKNTYIAEDGEEAFEIFQKEDIDIVLTDINMPNMNGVELIKKVQKSDKEAVIIVLSAHDESALLIELINLGIGNFLNKPVDKQLIINSLYSASRIIMDRKLVIEYEILIQKEMAAIDRKNLILEQKLNQIALQTNKNSIEEDASSQHKNIDSYYKNILQDDADELNELSHDIESYIAMLFQKNSINHEYLIHISNSYKKYASVLSTYPEFFEISTSLNMFASVIVDAEIKFMEDLHQTGIYFESLQLTLENYRVNVWTKEASNPRFYNASLKVDIEGVIDFLEGNEQESGEIEFF